MLGNEYPSEANASPPAAPRHTERSRWQRRPGKKLLIIVVCACIVVILLGLGYYWHQVNRRPAVTDPFSAKTLASLSFPVYYPTKLPAGYNIDAKSVTEPQAGVVVITLTGPKNQKIYISQEARPSTFNFGGYYNNFSDLKEKVIGSGTIAVGRINNGQTTIGSLATNKTWILTNTTAPVPLSQIINMLNSLAASH